MGMEKLKNKKPNVEKLLAFGFEKAGNEYVYITDLAEGRMLLTVIIDDKETICTRVVDGSGDEYVLHLVAGAAGPFVGRIKSEYDAVLREISEKCFDPDVFKGEQAKAVIAYIKDTYGDEPEYLWPKFPDNAIARRKDSRKWYAAFLNVSRRKLGMDSEKTVEILDLRIKPEEMENTVDHIRFFPGYHMNKKHWFTICLDGSVQIEEICQRVDESHLLAKK